MKKVYKFILCILTVFAVILSCLALPVFGSGDYNVSTMHTGVDSNSFKNSAEYFVGENEKSKYYVTKDELQKLLEGESEDTQTLILSQTLSPFSGSCYGISAAMALSYVGKVDLPAENFYSSDITQSKSLRNRINYYQLSQYCENKTAVKTNVVTNGKTAEDPLKQIAEYAKIGTPFLVGFRTANFAHEVVGCGYEHAEDGSHRIRIIDPEKTEGFMYLTISKDYGSWAFEDSPYSYDDIIDLDFITLDAFSRLDLAGEKGAVYSSVSSSALFDTVCTDFNSSFTLTNAKGENLTVENGNISGDMDYTVEKYIACAGEELNTKIVLTVDDSDEYSVQNNAERIDITVVGDKGLFFSVQGKNIENIKATEGSFTLEGENMEYSANSLSTEKNVQMMNITGADPDKITFETRDGVTVTDSQNGRVHVSLVSKGKISEGDCMLAEGHVKIVYSDIVKSNKVNDSGSELVKMLILMFIAVVFAVTLVYTYRKYKNKPNNKTKDEQKNG